MIDIEIKIDGKKVIQPYAPVTELNISECMKRNGWSIGRMANKLGVTNGAVHQMMSGNPTVSTLYKMAWAMNIDPRDFFFRMSEDGKIVEEPKVSFEKLKEWAELERLGPMFAQPPKDARQVMMCPNCGTTFLVTNVPHLAEKKKDTV